MSTAPRAKRPPRMACRASGVATSIAISAAHSAVRSQRSRCSRLPVVLSSVRVNSNRRMSDWAAGAFSALPPAADHAPSPAHEAMETSGSPIVSAAIATTNTTMAIERAGPGWTCGRRRAARPAWNARERRSRATEMTSRMKVASTNGAHVATARAVLPCCFHCRNASVANTCVGAPRRRMKPSTSTTAKSLSASTNARRNEPMTAGSTAGRVTVRHAADRPPRRRAASHGPAGMRARAGPTKRIVIG